MENIADLEKEIAFLRQQLSEKEALLNELKQRIYDKEPGDDDTYSEQFAVLQPVTPSNNYSTCIVGRLSRGAIERYSRQILLPNIGVEGQERLSRARVLIVGAGGLGCPALIYLAGAGVGALGIVDYDTVDITNLHRQILHGEADRGTNKVDSAARAVKRLNSQIKVDTYNVQLSASNALDIISNYDIVLDCTDNVVTRYLLNDSCIIAKVPLISGSALKMEGQLTIYGFRPPNQQDKESVGPCYRCLFPTPPPPETVGSCSAQGVLGCVTGVVGALQALEAVRVIAGGQSELSGAMLLFDGDQCRFRNVKLRGRNQNCPVCGDTSSKSLHGDYEEFCQSRAAEKELELKILDQNQRISPKDLNKKMTHNLKDGSGDRRTDTLDGAGHILVDVRSESEFRMCRIDGSVNYPIDSLSKRECFEELLSRVKAFREVTFVCRRGNDSQLAAKMVTDSLSGGLPVVNDLCGGLHAWSDQVDPNFPVY